jgi:hypothetical protein
LWEIILKYLDWFKHHSLIATFSIGIFFQIMFYEKMDCLYFSLKNVSGICSLKIKIPDEMNSFFDLLHRVFVEFYGYLLSMPF